MSHPVTLSSPPPRSLALPALPTLSLTAQSIFSLQYQLGSLARAVGAVRGGTQTLSFHPHTGLSSSDRDVKTTTFAKAAGTTSTDIHLCSRVAALLSEGAVIF